MEHLRPGSGTGAAASAAVSADQDYYGEGDVRSGLRSCCHYDFSGAQGQLGCCRRIHAVVFVLSLVSLVAATGISVWLFWAAKVWDRAQVALVIAIYCSTFATVNTAFLVFLHMQAWSVGKHQQRIVRILLMVPVYAIGATVALYFHHDAADYIDLVRDSYEAFVLFNFYELIICYVLSPEGVPPEEWPRIGLKRRKAVIKALSEHCELRMKHPPPLCMLRPLEVGTKVLAWWDGAVFQFVLLKPACTLVAIIGKACDVYDEDGGLTNYHNLYPPVLIMENLSVTIAFTCIFYLYLLTHDAVPKIAGVTCPNVTSKFVAIKLVVFLCFWQGMAIHMFVKFGWIHRSEEGDWTEDEIATGLQNWLVALEMFFISFLHKSVFSHKPYLYVLRRNQHRGLEASPAHKAAYEALIDFREVHESSTHCCTSFVAWLRGLEDIDDDATVGVPTPHHSRMPTEVPTLGEAPSSGERRASRARSASGASAAVAANAAGAAATDKAPLLVNEVQPAPAAVPTAAAAVVPAEEPAEDTQPPSRQGGDVPSAE
eukprot:TRINITY_DN8966_c0_g1_i1.p1 TRINITY_DN8966_c0_g1~~TRINITY_DN8966_c0_g1_i1.p1  ORF type:complete len:571 (+),score=183.03 TRINITY_DN8966_c0_g1_i1:90-1715(+)